jgi:uncharacterized membrane protein YedE/YeeE
VSRHRIVLAALASGLAFGAGLALSGMTDPQRVLGFLDVFGAFDPALLFVLGGAVATTVVSFPLVLRQPRPLFDERFRLSTLTAIDRPLLVGSALFGVGWGLAGYCPGPALAGLGVSSREALWFVPSMLAGMALHRAWERRAGGGGSTDRAPARDPCID